MNTTFTKTLFLGLITMFSLNIVSAQTAFWEEDFSTTSGLPTGWVSSDAMGADPSAGWIWCNDPSATNPCIINWTTYSNQHDGVFSSATGANGFVLFDSDGAGPINHNVQLTTDNINCSAQPVVWAKFESLLGVFGMATTDNAVLQVSNDGGNNWTTFNLWDIAPGNQGNEPGSIRWTVNPSYSIVDISSVAGSSATVSLRWAWAGNYEYYWLLDDVALYDADPTTIFIPANDIRMTDFFAPARNAFTPASQVEQFGFLADIENNGSSTQTGVNLNVTIVDDANSAVVYTEDLMYPDLAPQSDFQNEPFAGGGFTPEATPGKTYTGTYTLTSDSSSVDVNPMDNSRSFNFFVSDTLFSKDNGATRTVTPAADNWMDGEAHSWSYGCNYHVVSGTDLSGNQLHARYGTFMIGNAGDLGGTILTLKLYKWNEDLNNNQDAETDPVDNEVTVLAQTFYEVTGFEADTDLITLPLFPDGANVGPIPLEDDSDYILMIEYETSSTTVDFTALASEEFDYGAHDLRTDSLGMSRRTEMIALGNSLADLPITSAGFGLTPIVRLSIGEALLPPNAVEDILSDDNKMTVAPNPASSQIALNLDLVETHNDAIVRIIDITGQVVQEHFYNNVQNETFDYNVSQFAAGSYYIHFISEGGSKAVPFVVTK